MFTHCKFMLYKCMWVKHFMSIVQLYQRLQVLLNINFMQWHLHLKEEDFLYLMSQQRFCSEMMWCLACDTLIWNAHIFTSTSLHASLFALVIGCNFTYLLCVFADAQEVVLSIYLFSLFFLHFFEERCSTLLALCNLQR